ncbi:charged multivesicular body protein 7 [Galendromus occidentalis]|uniref:Charged multivesicular body protein 7 n=1 Tax=Galendromus occidentalis TaxID=34638 RepID=A0AAJ6QW94_9ACAR|nr:charged multivesicular body protein 7 [Galendromus occidentalis]
MFEFPKDWDDDERMAFLFRDLKPRHINPLGHDEKLDFWKRLILKFTKQRNKAIFSMQSLMEDFTRKNSQPVCLWPVLESLKKDGLIRPTRAPGWGEWISSWFVSPSPEQGTVFVNARVFDKTLKEVRDALRGNRYSGTHIPYQDMWNSCRRTCDDNEALFKLVLESMADLTVKDDLVVFAADSDLIKLMTDHDKALLSISDAVNKISEKIEQHIQQIKDLKALALKHKHEGNQKSAMAALRRKRRTEERLEKQYAVLDQLYQMHSDLESQKDMAKILDGFKLATSALKSANSDIDKAHNIVDELQDAAAEHRDIEESISSALTPEAQQSELEEELQRLLEESEPIPELPSVPSVEPGSSKTKKDFVGDTEPQQKKRVPLGYFD